jgi:hypothetical protein
MSHKLATETEDKDVKDERKRVSKLVGKCRHFSGIMDKTCKAGICYRELVGGPDLGWATRLPCHGKSDPEIVPCDKYDALTDECIARIEAEREASAERFCKAIPIIGAVKEDHRGEDWEGDVTCPVCGGVLHLSHAAHNGHVWGRCETKGCLAWME